MANNTLRSLYRWCRRYISLTLVIVVGLIVYVTGFNDNSFINIHHYKQQIKELKAEIKENRDTLEYYEALNRRLDTDPVTMERIVREQYHMQRSGEDIYVFE
ncbi:MAG: septum formation initiator family protein [Muribaculaceae bacterium]|nr:septum formation initiator family protein [Muribaculaceae bacterium]